MKEWIGWFLVSWALLSPVYSAEKPVLDDFAYGIRIEVPSGAALVVLDLPLPVYRNTGRQDWGDIRIFNADGEPVPHTLRPVRAQPADTPSWRDLVFFPLPEPDNPVHDPFHFYVRTAPEETVVRIDPHVESPPMRTGRSYLIDLRPDERNLAELRLEWPSGSTDLLVSLGLDASDDLVNWTSLQPRWVVSDIRFAGHRLRNQTLPLTSSGKRYLRIRQLDSGPIFAPVRIEGRPGPKGRTPLRTFLAVDGQRSPDSPDVFEYRLDGAFPVDRVRLRFDQANSMAEAAIESRNDPRTDWTRRFRGLFYRIDLESTILTGEPQAVPVSMDRFWRLTVDASASAIGRSIPRLEVGFRPHELFFIARGGGPFTLAFGSARVGPSTVNPTALVENIDAHREKGILQVGIPQGEPFPLGGPQRLTPQAQPLPMRRIALWSTLLAGVLVVGGMAWRLARRMKP